MNSNRAYAILAMVLIVGCTTKSSNSPNSPAAPNIAALLAGSNTPVCGFNNYREGVGVISGVIIQSVPFLGGNYLTINITLSKFGPKGSVTALAKPQQIALLLPLATVSAKASGLPIPFATTMAADACDQNLNNMIAAFNLNMLSWDSNGSVVATAVLNKSVTIAGNLMQGSQLQWPYAWLTN